MPVKVWHRSPAHLHVVSPARASKKAAGREVELRHSPTFYIAQRTAVEDYD